ncbi:MAG: hypothetical protein ABWY82_06895 [Tardiphaga sp.]
MCDDEEADEQEFLAFQQRSAGAPAPDKVKTRARKTADRFAMVPIWWVEQAAKATNTPRALMLVWLLYLAWETKSNTFSLTNVKLRGVHRNTKYKMLLELETAGLIQVSREGKKAPLVTLLYL